MQIAERRFASKLDPEMGCAPLVRALLSSLHPIERPRQEAVRANEIAAELVESVGEREGDLLFCRCRLPALIAGSAGGQREDRHGGVGVSVWFSHEHRQ